MNAKDFLKKLHHERIVEAIREAEKKTSGEIRVFISRKPTEDPVSTAQAHFVQMGMDKTRDRNGVLTFVAPRAHKFAVIGDAAVHARCGEAQAHLLIRTNGRTDPVPPGWETHPVSLEELTLAYLREPGAAALPGPARGRNAGAWQVTK